MKIFYGICGEGMGHAGRSLALIERLVSLGHRVTIFTFADAFQLLANSGYEPRLIEGLQFRTTPAGGVNSLGTISNYFRFLRNRRTSLDFIRQLAIAERPDLFITDFEPLTAIAAASLRTECISVDNQHRFCEPLGEAFPLRLRAYGRAAGEFVRRWIKRPRMCVVAVFHQCPVSHRYRSVDALLRERITKLKPSEGEHILLYAKGMMGQRLARAASSTSARFIAYGFRGPDAANITYKNTSSDEFIGDLASCRGVLCTAGQQLMGEARYFGKPLLVVPMPGQHEQEINGYYARSEGIGDYSMIEDLDGPRIQRAFDKRTQTTKTGNGVDQVLDLLGIGYG